jgi:hypothetical protein
MERLRVCVRHSLPGERIATESEDTEGERATGTHLLESRERRTNEDTERKREREREREKRTTHFLEGAQKSEDTERNRTSEGHSRPVERRAKYK